MSDLAEAELRAQLRAGKERIAELETARLGVQTLFEVTRALGKTLSLQDTFEVVFGDVSRGTAAGGLGQRGSAGRQVGGAQHA